MEFKALAAIGLIAAASPALAQDGERAPLSFADMFELEMAADPQISPDGERIVYQRRSNDIMTDRTRSALWAINFDGSGHEAIVSGMGDATGARWSPDGSRLLYLARSEPDPESDERPATRLIARDMATGEETVLFEPETGVNNTAWSPDGRWVAFTMFVRDDGPQVDFEMPEKPEGAEWADVPRIDETTRYQFDGQGDLPHGQNQIFVISTEGGGEPRALTEAASGNLGGLEWSGDSTTLYYSHGGRAEDGFDGRETDIWAISLNGGEPRRITDDSGPETSPRLSPDGARLAYTGYENQGFSNQDARLYVRDLESGDTVQLLEDLDRSISSAVWDETGEGLWIQFVDQGLTTLAHVTLDGELTRIDDTLGGLLFGRPYTSGSFSVSSNGRYAATVGTPQRLANLGVGERGGETRVLTSYSEELLASRELAEIERFTWESSADGREIEGWIAYPPGFDPEQQYPMLMEIHGGPHTAYGPVFSGEVQLFAAAGYVVFYTNPRGSTSYGEEFSNLIDKTYPDEDVDDLLSGVDALVAEGFIDENRLFVTGGSGGGVLTSTIVGVDHRFAAAATVKPVINWTSFALASDIGVSIAPYWFGTTPWEDPDLFWQRSPLSLVGEVETPTLVLVGGDDRRTPVFESEQYYNALQIRGVPTRFVRIPGGAHGFEESRPSRLLNKVGHILAWFDEHDRRDAREGGSEQALP
ncbi:S9 family peptidase [Glycocaulis profundi]|nr:S9 family peptidase [Glycocaulis profundi]